ncbi:F-box/LRR-repeat protein [Actinidia chinensis var. chinensis]|uniref:F-box/LRR-repeat protein n=1 Tax=Actinidia chinensis var. chinensis TaxID=1590841 RepID=A0A2R6P636_ACTCC|nr:F-box/LRR-repeat protein [Actinidia chinensis var. chinensis]
MEGRRPHPATAVPTTPASDAFPPKRGKKRGNYNCGRCGLPKKGHQCHISAAATPADSTSSATAASVPSPPLQQYPNLRRALSFDDIDVLDPPESDDDEEENAPEWDQVIDSCRLPESCMWEVLRRLPPPALLSAAKVCKGWRDTTRRLWRAAAELRLRVPAKAQVGFVGSVLQKCPGLVRLYLRMESDVDATMLACIAFSCPNLESLEISTSSSSVNWINGDELGRFVADKRCLTTLKMEGCSNLGGFFLYSSSLSTLWLSDLHSVSKMVFNCPNLKEISLDFSRQENDNTDLTTMVDGLGRSCPRLQNIHIASLRLSHAVVLALTDANLRGLRMLSLVLGSEITDASVASIASSYSNLELLDLSGSSISDSGIGMICNVFPETLSRLLLALCPNITSSGIQFAAAQLPLLELMDCGMTICDPNCQSSTSEESNDRELQKTPNSKLHLIYQKLIIKHSRLKRLSLWGCSGLDALYLNCPKLNDLNLNSCSNLHPERLLLQCPNLDSVHAFGCQDMLVQTIQNLLSSETAAMENHFARKRLADGSKRIQAPHFFSQQATDYGKKGRRVFKHWCTLIVD